MEHRVIPVFVTIFIAIVGFVVKKKKCTELQKRIDFTIRFQSILVELADHFFEYGDFSTKAYDEYMESADAMQIELGDDGIISILDPLKNVQIKKYQLVLNLIPELRSFCHLVCSNSIVVERLNQMVGTTDDALRRHVGNLKRICEHEAEESHNPFICFAEGIRTILRLPGKILVWLGLVGGSTEQKFCTGIIFKAIGWFATLIGFVSAVMTIVLGWNQCLEIIEKLMK